MMFRPTTLVLFFLFFHNLIAQTVQEPARYKPNMIYTEVLGNGVGYTINYERMLKQVPGNCFGMRAGYGVVPPAGEHGTVQTIPVEAIWTKGIKHHIESGFGTTILIDEKVPEKPGYAFAIRIGYRYQAPGGFLVVRAGAALFLGSNTSSAVQFLPGVALGFAL